MSPVQMESRRQPFAVVVSGPSRLAFAGSAETVAALVPVHAPRSILPGDWGDNPAWYVFPTLPEPNAYIFGPEAHRPD